MDREHGEREDSGLRSSLALLVMLAPNATLGITLAVMPPILPQLASVLHGMQPAQLMTSIAAFGMIAGGLFSGRLLHYLGVRPLTLASLLLFAVSGTSGFFLDDVFLLAASRFVLGIAGVCFSTAAMALTTARYVGEARSKVIGWQQAASQIVNVATVFLVGLLAQALGWRSPFVLLGLYASCLLLVSALSVRPLPLLTEAQISRSGAGNYLRIMLPMCAIAVLMGILTLVPMTQLPFALSDSGLGDVRHVSLVGGVNFAFAAISAIGYGWLTHRIGKRSAFALGLIIGTAGIALMGQTASLSGFCLSAGLAGLGTGLYNTFVFDVGVEIAPPGRQADGAGLLFSFIFLGAAINPLAVQPFQAAFGLHGGLIALGIAGLMGGLGGVRIGRARSVSSDTSAV